MTCIKVQLGKRQPLRTPNHPKRRRPLHKSHPLISVCQLYMLCKCTRHPGVGPPILKSYRGLSTRSDMAVQQLQFWATSNRRKWLCILHVRLHAEKLHPGSADQAVDAQPHPAGGEGAEGLTAAVVSSTLWQTRGVWRKPTFASNPTAFIWDVTRHVSSRCSSGRSSRFGSQTIRRGDDRITKATLMFSVF